MEGGRTLGLVTRAVRAERDVDNVDRGRGSAQQKLILVHNQPAFVMGRSKNADVAEWAEAEFREKGQKDVEGSAGSDKSRGKSTDLTKEKNNLYSNERGICISEKAISHRQLLRQNNAFSADMNSASKTTHYWSSDNLSFTNNMHVNLGQTRPAYLTCQISQYTNSGQEQGKNVGNLNGDDMGRAHL